MARRWRYIKHPSVQRTAPLYSLSPAGRAAPRPRTRPSLFRRLLVLLLLRLREAAAPRCTPTSLSVRFAVNPCREGEWESGRVGESWARGRRVLGLEGEKSQVNGKGRRRQRGRAAALQRAFLLARVSAFTLNSTNQSTHWRRVQTLLLTRLATERVHGLKMRTRCWFKFKLAP